MGKLLGQRARQSHENPIALARMFDRQARSPELHSLIEALNRYAKESWPNSILRGWVKWFGWILIVLAVVAAVSSRLAGPILWLALSLGSGDRHSRCDLARPALALRGRAPTGFRRRPEGSVSTAMFLGAVQDPNGIVGEQRRDALDRVGKFDRRELFPLAWPGNGKRAGALVLLVAGLFAYRIHHRPPLISLLQSTAHSQLLQSILAPFARTVEKDIQRTIAMVTAKPDTVGEDTQRTEEAATEDLWKS